MVNGLPPIKLPPNSRESCIMKKQHRERFSIGSSNGERVPLDLVHTDICDLMQTLS